MKRWLEKLLWPAAKRFIAGSSMRRALKTAWKCERRYLGATIDILGEECQSREEAQKAFEKYKKIIIAIFYRESLKNTGISLKLSHFGLKFNEIYCEKIVREIVRNANARSIFVWIDMESDLYFRHVLDTAVKLRLDYPNVGVAYQAYRRDALEYLPPLIESQIAIRLCKGAYRESNEVVFKKTKDIRRNFLSLADKILRVNRNYLAVATHDEYLLNQIRIFAKKNKISRGKFEFQMLLGLDRKLSWLASLGYRCVVYVPFGKNWLPYILRRIWEKPLTTLLMAWKGWRQSGQ